jgi:hypothetical protein
MTRPTRDPAVIQLESELKAQDAEFLKRGGKVKEIPSGRQDLEKVPFTITSEKKRRERGA